MKTHHSTTITLASFLIFLGVMPINVPAPIVCTNTVQNAFDSGPGSLRAALASATNGETITFCTNVTGSITLTSGPLFVTNSVTIFGPGPAVLAINGNGTDGVFRVASNLVVTITGLAITNGNVGGTFGGGIYNDHSTLTVSNCLLSGNSAADGGGIYNNGSDSGSATLTVVAGTLSGNQAEEAGAGIYNDGQGGGTAILTVTNSTLDHNSVRNGDGGAIFNQTASGFATVMVYNSTLSTNTAVFTGGGISTLGSPAPGDPEDPGPAPPVLIVNSTLNGNSAPRGDSISSGGQQLIIGSTILSAGSSGTNISTAGSVSVFSFGYNLCSDGGGGALTNSGDIVNTPALLGPLQDNGGPTLTHAPLCGSPAIDRGKNLFKLASDQRGAPRTFDIAGITNATGGNGTDIGAVESPIFAFTVLNRNDSGPGSLRAAITSANASSGIDLIQFDPAAYGTIPLLGGELLITDCVIVDGPGATNVAVNGNGIFRVFHITPGKVVSIAGLTITNGSPTPPSSAGLITPEGTTGFQSGGGIYNDHSILTVNNCTVTGNRAGSGGGIASDASISGTATLNIFVSAIYSNSAAGGFGGGIFNNGTGGHAELTLVNTTVSGNSSSGSGGAIANVGELTSGVLEILNCTLNSNSAAFYGPGIFNQGAPAGPASATVTIGSTILNSSTIANFGGILTSLGYNLSSDPVIGLLPNPTDLINTNPMLGPLQLNGGQTPTHALLCGSPAIDAGTNFLRLATDQRGDGFPRTVGPATDIGAFEAQTPPTCNQPPVALCTNVTVSAGANCMADASIDNGSYDPDAGDTITNRVQTPPGPYQLGTNLVTLTVTDSHGATNSCQATVTVVDTTPPTVNCPASIVVTNDTLQCSAVVNYTVTATDNCSPVTNITEDLPSGSMFSRGTNTVHVTAVDDAGNTNTCSFTVTVLDKEPPQVACFPAPNPSGKVTEPGKNGSSGASPNGYYQLLAKDNCDPSPKIYVKDTASNFVAGPFKDGDIVRLKHAGGAPSQSSGTGSVVAVINLKGNGLNVAQDADGNRTPDSAGCVMQVSLTK